MKYLVTLLLATLFFTSCEDNCETFINIFKYH